MMNFKRRESEKAKTRKINFIKKKKPLADGLNLTGG